jgi:hypothetical protein
MASEYYLYSPQTNEAVEVMRCGANGLQTPQGSPKALFAFMSYHMGKNATYRLTELQTIGGDIEFVCSLEELEEQRRFHQDMDSQATLVLLWEENFVDELLGREPEQLRAIHGYEFNNPTLKR